MQPVTRTNIKKQLIRYEYFKKILFETRLINDLIFLFNI